MFTVIFVVFAALCVTWLYSLLSKPTSQQHAAVEKPAPIAKLPSPWDPINIPDPHRSEATEEEFAAVADRLGAEHKKFIFGTQEARTEDGHTGWLSFMEYRFSSPPIHCFLHLGGGKLELAVEKVSHDADISDKGLASVVIWDASGDELSSFKEFEDSYLNLNIGETVRQLPGTYNLEHRPLRFIVRIETDTGETACYAITAIDEVIYMM